ncbi:MAG TPA: hypothetical protein DCS09_10225, partial [Porphyromonadaceae bacterium]|nr:hypothetical protein [Porphyromonadaceae bacterium]
NSVAQLDFVVNRDGNTIIPRGDDKIELGDRIYLVARKKDIAEVEAHFHFTSKAPKKVFIIGGGQLYRATLGLADQLYLTRIHHTFSDADTFFPEIDFDEWRLTEKEMHEADDKHRYPYTFLTYSKK